MHGVHDARARDVRSEAPVYYDQFHHYTINC